jgi:hypothetical protein
VHDVAGAVRACAVAYALRGVRRGVQPVGSAT